MDTLQTAGGWGWGGRVFQSVVDLGSLPDSEIEGDPAMKIHTSLNRTFCKRTASKVTCVCVHLRVLLLQPGGHPLVLLLLRD